MELSANIFTLIPTHQFGISRETRSEYQSILIRISDGNTTGYGEAFPSNRYEDSAESNFNVLQDADFSEMVTYLDTFQPLPFQRFISEQCREIDSLIAGLSGAYYDYFGKKYDLPIPEMIGTGGLPLPVSSFTIGIDNLDVIRQKVEEAKPYPLLKIKLGTENDEEIMQVIRELTDKPIRVDANEGWDKQVALEKIEWLNTENVEFIEQPIPAGNYDDVRWLQERSPLPIIADEDCRHVEDVPLLMDCYDGINIKLVKCGGITPAIQMIHTARTYHKSIMLGCMVESSAGIAPAAVLGGLVDYLDLDGNLLLSNDPFDGPRAENGEFGPFERNGLGVSPKTDMHWTVLYTE